MNSLVKSEASIYLGHFTNKILDSLHTNTPQFLSLPVHQMKSLVRSKLDLDIPLGIVVEPLLDVHLVHCLPVVVLQ